MSSNLQARKCSRDFSSNWTGSSRDSAQNTPLPGGRAAVDPCRSRTAKLAPRPAVRRPLARPGRRLGGSPSPSEFHLECARARLAPLPQRWQRSQGARTGRTRRRPSPDFLTPDITPLISFPNRSRRWPSTSGKKAQAPERLPKWTFLHGKGIDPLRLRGSIAAMDITDTRSIFHPIFHRSIELRCTRIRVFRYRSNSFPNGFSRGRVWVPADVRPSPVGRRSPAGCLSASAPVSRTTAAPGAPRTPRPRAPGRIEAGSCQRWWR